MENNLLPAFYWGRQSPLSADVVGYSRLMEADEAWTIQNLKENKKLMSSLIEEHNGRVVDAPGDNLLAEFNSVINAVECAVKIQQELKKINDSAIETHRMYFRIGVNLGDVVEEDGRIYGNGINIAARLEGLAEPGGICISRTAFDQVRSKFDIGYEYLGEHNVKNITLPVLVYRVLLGSEYAGKVIEEKNKSGEILSRRNIVIVFIIILAGLFVWRFYPNQRIKTVPDSIETKQTTVASKVKETSKSIAVLPFDDLSPEKDQEYFVLGLSEEILNNLSNISDLHVTSKTSSFAFMDSEKAFKEIADILGVSYILEGSVRKAGDALRITTQLIYVADDRHLWSETYDRELKDIFKIQEDIAIKVADKLKLTLGIGSLRQVSATHNFESYELYFKAKGKDIKEKLERVDRMLQDRGLESIENMKFFFDEDIQEKQGESDTP